MRATQDRRCRPDRQTDRGTGERARSGCAAAQLRPAVLAVRMASLRRSRPCGGGGWGSTRSWSSTTWSWARTPPHTRGVGSPVAPTNHVWSRCRRRRCDRRAHRATSPRGAAGQNRRDAGHIVRWSTRTRCCRRLVARGVRRLRHAVVRSRPKTGRDARRLPRVVAWRAGDHSCERVPLRADHVSAHACASWRGAGPNRPARCTSGMSSVWCTGSTAGFRS